MRRLFSCLLAFSLALPGLATELFQGYFDQATQELVLDVGYRDCQTRTFAVVNDGMCLERYPGECYAYLQTLPSGVRCAESGMTYREETVRLPISTMMTRYWLNIYDETSSSKTPQVKVFVRTAPTPQGGGCAR